jgi:hypothetical protein
MGPFFHFLWGFLYFLGGKKWGHICIFWGDIRHFLGGFLYLVGSFLILSIKQGYFDYNFKKMNIIQFYAIICFIHRCLVINAFPIKSRYIKIL